ncbi:hypothetical protein, partial [Variovorax ginsengisoli]
SLSAKPSIITRFLQNLQAFEDFFHPPLTQHNLFSHTKLASSEAFDYVTDFSIHTKLKVFFSRLTHPWDLSASGAMGTVGRVLEYTTGFGEREAVLQENLP